MFEEDKLYIQSVGDHSIEALNFLTLKLCYVCADDNGCENDDDAYNGDENDDDDHVSDIHFKEAELNQVSIHFIFSFLAICYARHACGSEIN